jgi:hypothetical protein
MSTYHIKQNGKFLCGKKLKNVPYISFAAAERATLAQCCVICLSKYNEIMNGLSKTLHNG